MPEMSGIEALQKIRRSPFAYDTPVLMLTARRSEMDVFIAMRAGANEYLKKPFDTDQLVAIVEDMLEKSFDATRGESGRSTSKGL
jgi:DNA-binding response OmpR family regulator